MKKVEKAGRECRCGTLGLGRVGRSPGELDLCEAVIFEVFEPDCREIKQVFLDLATATSEHYNRIKTAWNENK